MWMVLEYLNSSKTFDVNLETSGSELFMRELNTKLFVYVKRQGNVFSAR